MVKGTRTRKGDLCRTSSRFGKREILAGGFELSNFLACATRVGRAGAESGPYQGGSLVGGRCDRFSRAARGLLAKAGEQSRAPAEDQRGAGAQAEPWVENPPPMLGGGRGRVGGFSFPIAPDVPDAAQVTPFHPSAGTRVAPGKDRINSWVSSA